MTASGRIGFIQGRLSPLVDGKIQAFPAAHWREEFTVAENLGIALMEWTLDQDGLHSNPFTTTEGQRDIATLCLRHGVRIPSVTGDCFMQAPFWKAEGATRQALLDDFRLVIRSARAVGTDTIVVPLVDNGSIASRSQEDSLREGLDMLVPLLREQRVRLSFETDMGPRKFAEFLTSLDPELFGANYDIGNSAALGFGPREEWAAYGHRVTNVHVKDRALGGTTVPLGEGNADFPTVFRAMHRAEYEGNCILQTARAKDGNHPLALESYRNMVLRWIEEACT
ncbi:MAG: sugar phosphate isomerase/epimerase family protein [Desulfovibrionaceae bacterium]